jgi:anti-anti-sigma regulatory factor
MNSPVSIAVRKFFNSSSLHTREQAQYLFEQINKSILRTKMLYVDFSDISFISRSFADELVQLKSKSTQHDQIEFCCTTPNVSKMLEAVESTRNGKITSINIPVRRFTNTESLLSYFSE